MNRRAFLKALLGTAAASTTTYFLPPINGWTSDVIEHPAMIYSSEIEGWPLRVVIDAKARQMGWSEMTNRMLIRDSLIWRYSQS